MMAQPLALSLLLHTLFSFQSTACARTRRERCNNIKNIKVKKEKKKSFAFGSARPLLRVLCGAVNIYNQTL
jgi:hypothetical protein